jgi:hypothetical protein
MMRRVLLTVAIAVLFSTAVHGKTGVVFIHGKGGSNLAQASVARAYWGEDMIRATTERSTCGWPAGRWRARSTTG